MFWLSELGPLITALLNLVSLLHQHYNDPALIAQKIRQMAQNVTDQTNEAQRVLQDPTATKADKDAAFEKIKLLDS